MLNVLLARDVVCNYCQVSRDHVASIITRRSTFRFWYNLQHEQARASWFFRRCPPGFGDTCVEGAPFDLSMAAAYVDVASFDRLPSRKSSNIKMSVTICTVGGFNADNVIDAMDETPGIHCQNQTSPYLLTSRVWSMVELERDMFGVR